MPDGRPSAASGPELLARQLDPLSHGPHLGPADVWVDSVAVPAIRAGDHVLAPHDPGVGQDAIRNLSRPTGLCPMRGALRSNPTILRCCLRDVAKPPPAKMDIFFDFLDTQGLN